MRIPVCTPRYPTAAELEISIKVAIEANPNNRPPDWHPGETPIGGGDRASVDLFRYWGEAGVYLTVGFLDTKDAALRERILFHMNAWGERANVTFVESETEAQVRITRWTDADSPQWSGYWSRLGTDIGIVADKHFPTMNLEAFTMDTPDTEFYRVVRHETGHTLGFPHEHMRAEVIKRLDPEKVISHYMRTQHWSRQVVIQQILTPLETSSVLGTATDETSIMCYQIDGSLTRDGKPVIGGVDINATDHEFAAQVYPRKAT